MLLRQADYLLAVKDNQPTLHQAIQSYFSDANEANFKEYDIDFAETIKKGHGRVEERRCWVGYDALPLLDNSQKWKNLETIVMVESIRTVNEETTIEHRYYISSSNGTASKLLRDKRSHWGIENSLHWRLDIA